MLRVSRAAVAVVLLAALLAGCSNPPAKPDVGQIELLEAPPPEAGKGSISGVVVDEAIRPLVGANITISGLETTATTDEGGLFLVTDLEPGLYILSANMPTYMSIQTTAEVVAGETTKVRIVLAFDPTPQAYHTTLQFEWFDQAGVTLVDFTVDLVSRSFLGGAVPPFCDRCYFYFQSDGAVEEFIVEAIWKDSVPTPTGATSYFWTLDDMEGGDYKADYFQSPGRAAVGGNTFGNSTSFGIGMSGDETWITFQQTARMFITMFYLGPAPENWSFIADNP